MVVETHPASKHTRHRNTPASKHTGIEARRHRNARPAFPANPALGAGQVHPTARSKSFCASIVQGFAFVHHSNVPPARTETQLGKTSCPKISQNSNGQVHRMKLRGGRSCGVKPQPRSRGKASKTIPACDPPRTKTPMRTARFTPQQEAKALTCQNSTQNEPARA